MKWLVQKNLSNRTFEGILSCLDNTGRDVTTVSFTMDDINRDLFDVLPVLEPYFGKGSILDNGTIGPPTLGVFGSVAFMEFISKHISLRYCPTISSVDDQFYFMKSVFGRDYLNFNAEYVLPSNLKIYFNRIPKAFIKPLGKKTFPGVILQSEDFLDPDKQEIIKAIRNEHAVMFSTDIKKIVREMRFWVIDRKIVTHSTYVIDGLVEPIREVSEEAITFAEAMIKKCPLFAYTLDIAEIIEDGRSSMKVIELNCINTSGTYDADESAIIDKIEEIGTIPGEDGFFIGDNDNIIHFKDCGSDEDIEEWENQTPFSENFLNWFESMDYDPMILLLEETKSWYKLPLSEVTNQIISRSDPGADTLIIDNTDVKLLYKLSWE